MRACGGAGLLEIVVRREFSGPLVQDTRHVRIEYVGDVGRIRGGSGSGEFETNVQVAILGQSSTRVLVRN